MIGRDIWMDRFVNKTSDLGRRFKILDSIDLHYLLLLECPLPFSVEVMRIASDVGTGAVRSLESLSV